MSQKEHIDWTKVFSIQVEDKIFTLRTKQFGKEGTEYSGGLILLTHSVIFQLKWLDKRWKNKKKSSVASSF